MNIIKFKYFENNNYTIDPIDYDDKLYLEIDGYQNFKIKMEHSIKSICKKICKEKNIKYNLSSNTIVFKNDVIKLQVFYFEYKLIKNQIVFELLDMVGNSLRDNIDLFNLDSDSDYLTISDIERIMIKKINNSYGGNNKIQ